MDEEHESNTQLILSNPNNLASSSQTDSSMLSFFEVVSLIKLVFLLASIADQPAYKDGSIFFGNSNYLSYHADRKLLTSINS
jgi:hypothetical protein